MAVPRYRVTLTPEERKQLAALTRAATKTTGKRFLYARALLLCDRGADGPGWSVARVSEALGVSAHTLERLKQRFVEQGLEAALERAPLPVEPDKPARIEHEYVRNGVEQVFLEVEPPGGQQRQIGAGERRTRRDWALWIAGMLETRYRQVERVVLVMDNLNTHGIESL